MPGGEEKNLHLALDVHSEDTLVGVSALFRQVMDVIESVARKDCVVLLEGESGTGKELFARRLHALSDRKHAPFIPVNCPATSESLFESQFYGHVKGAFTGAGSDTLGAVRAAEGGTLLLDEIGELQLNLQPKLLRLLQEKEVTPVGAPHPLKVNTRFVASTNRSLARSVAAGAFRADLYHRLNIVRVEIPPLRSRPEDIDPLVDFYLRYFADEYDTDPITISDSLRSQLRQYHWPGNVRELCGYLERLYAANLRPAAPGGHEWEDGYSSSYIPSAGMPVINKGYIPIAPTASSAHGLLTLAEAERQAILNALRAVNSNRSRAAQILDIHRSTLIRKINTFGLNL